ncbi:MULTISPECIES: sugar O-acetyltransferase [Xanthomonas]|uniref:sugar O-acetyltransferase n=1 Tax=Xanthomonas TaxID=338 RepID=UPI001ADA29A3|nr:sugar O-acetyltransferase [Xanthomonas phaseoli]MBO9769483.1 sugar O-acetyltransferase [Xanthomonas phaseoli pv. dieffenbachiae]MBO9778173.1 sugar O-acetyltransferase [Xanthomonas phaseoli pv. dieffenbachiae]MBO9778200.1 sugar O-acetyltransferase [Xanthomonas phaseoli pv. dieffenbachiae]MBO9798343.1 sugar O-acetyltransferase [Xanthomonas phaseoli pv. dieffenbachiae]MBO9802391.1 sugar O-acetyltransferase [Xanthomonas phaseoli pv. dieffenbachiae]
MQTEKQKMLAGELYNATDAQLQADQAAAAAWMARYNATGAQPAAQRHALLVERLAEVGAGAVILPPFHCDYGYNIHLGAGVFLNFNCVILDICQVHIGEGTQVGPAVQFYAADHPRDAAGRASGLEFGQPIRVGRNVWIGGGAIILPGVSIGDDAVIGAGAVVTRDVPAGATAVGNPARVRVPRGAADDAPTD